MVGSADATSAIVDVGGRKMADILVLEDVDGEGNAEWLVGSL